MGVLDELLAEAWRMGLDVEERPGTPPHLSDAVRRVARRHASSPVPNETPRRQTANRLVVTSRVEPVSPGDWMLLDLPFGAGLIPVRRLAADLAHAGAQLHEVLRLPEDRVVALAHGTATPEAVGPLFEAAPGFRGVLEAGRTAAGEEVLIWANAEVAGRAQAAATAAALARPGPAEADLRRQLEARREVEGRLRERITEISASWGFRIERKLKHLTRRLTRRAR
jgi:hypothetical protein